DEPATQIDLLNGIRGCEVHARIPLGEGADRRSPFVCLIQQLGGLVDVDASHRPASSSIRPRAISTTARACNSNCSTRSTAPPPISLAMNSPSAPAKA